jgi:hypothetical protein
MDREFLPQRSYESLQAKFELLSVSIRVFDRDHNDSQSDEDDRENHVLGRPTDLSWPRTPRTVSFTPGSASSLRGETGEAMSFVLYSIGFAILIAGLIYAAHLMHVPTQWIAMLAIVLLGIGILSGVKATRQKDPQAWFRQSAHHIDHGAVRFRLR